MAIAPPEFEIESCLDIVSVYFRDVADAEQSPDGADEMVTRVFEVPRNFIRLANAPDPVAEDDPFGGGGDDIVRDRPIRRDPRELCMAVGVDFPQGASATFDTAAGNLIVRNTRANLELVQTYIDSIWQQVPSVIELVAEIYSLPKLEALELGLAGAELADRLRTMASAGEAELVDRLSIAASDADRVTTSSGRVLKSVSGYIVEDGKDIAVEETAFLGARLEASVRLEEGDGALLVDVVLSKTFGEPEIIDSVALAPISGKEMPISRVVVDQAQIQTKIRLLSAEPRLLATFSPGHGKSDQLCLVLLRASSKKLGR